MKQRYVFVAAPDICIGNSTEKDDRDSHNDYYKLEHTTWIREKQYMIQSDNRMKLTFYFAGDDQKEQAIYSSFFLT
jgi:hypothetical protein